MDGMNKVISLILGLIVVVVIVAIVAGRLNLTKRFLSSSKNGNASVLTPFPTTTPSKGSPTPTKTAAQRALPTAVSRTKGGVATNEIPKTGPSEVFMLSTLVLMGGGLILRRIGR